jgi:hypothetical protein
MAVGIAQSVHLLGYRVDVRVVLIRFLAEAGVFFFPQNIRTGSWTQFLIQWLLYSLPMGVYWPGRED